FYPTVLLTIYWLGIAYEVKTRIIGLDGEFFIPELNC
ncbi:unnamed protein product, partial [marine sediment metagenome]